MNPKLRWMFSLLLAGLSALLAVSAHAQNANQGVTEMVGDYVIKPNNCFQPDFKGEKNTHLLMDRETGTGVELDVTGIDLAKLRTGSRVKVRGSMRTENAATPGNPAQRKVLKAEAMVPVEDPAASGSEPSVTQQAATEPPPSAGAVAVTDFKCLLLFANTSDYTVDQIKKTTSENYLFGTGGNVSDAFFDSTYGHYRLVQGDSVILDLTNETASANNSDQMRTLMHNKAKAMNYDPVTGASKPYQRVFFFMPNGVTGISTAWAYVDSIGGAWCHSVYSYSWSGAFFDGHAHENSHNCGLQHSNEGTTEYGDETCVMGYSHSSSGKTAISTLNPVKKAQLGVFNAYPGSKVDLSIDSTLNMYPLATSPATQAGVRCVTFAGKNYYISYMRDLAPYGKIWTKDAAKADKIVVYSNTSFDTFSYLDGYINEGGTYAAGDVTIKFERYNNSTSKDYATVSFDLNDGNAKPVANAQSVTASKNTAKAITLTGSDANTTNTLTYAVVTNPANGTLSGTPPNLTYTPSSNFLGADNFLFSVNDGRISSFATVSISVIEANTAPVASAQSVNVFRNTAEPITLVATDADGNSLTYSIVSGPTKGSLSAISGANVTYTPNTNYSGSDSFTFRANDGQANSNTATVSITVSSSPNTPPMVNAGPDQTIYLTGQSAEWTPADMATVAWYDAADYSTITESSGAVSRWNDKSTNGNHIVTTTSPTYRSSDSRLNNKPSIGYDLARKYLQTPSMTTRKVYVVTYYADPDNKFDSWDILISSQDATPRFGGWSGQNYFQDNGIDYSYLNGNSSTNYSASVTVLPMAASIWTVKWDADETGAWKILAGNQTYNAWTYGAVGEVIFTDGTEDAETTQKVEGYLAHKWGTATNLPVGHNYRSARPMKSTASATATLAGEVTDAEDVPTKTWSDTETGTGTGTVTFSSANALDSTAAFTATGTYILRLTADDGYSQPTDEVTITVNPPLPAAYASWASGVFSQAFRNLSPTGNGDGDALNNMMEFAFGTDPTVSDGRPLLADGTRNGQPVPVKTAGGVMEFHFMRRKDFGTSGSVSYKTQFSTDLGTFTDSTAIPDFVANSTANSAYDVVKVRFPAGAKFGRVQVSFVP